MLNNRSSLSAAFQVAVLSRPKALQDTIILLSCWILASLPWLIGNHFIPYDSIDFYYPQSRFVTDSLRAGDWPWWNPYQFSGTPVFGDPQGMLFTVHTLVGLFLGEAYTLKTFDVVTLLHPLLGAFAIYAIGYSLKVPRAWVLLGALVFMIGGVATSRLQHVTQIASYGWLPVLLYLLMDVSRRPTLGRAILLGLLGAFWMANANQVVFLGGIFLIGMAFYALARSGFSRHVLAMYFLSAGIATGLVVPVYAAIFEVVGLSGRVELPIEMSAWSSFPLVVYSSLVLPALYGNVIGPVWAPTDVTQDYLYIGLLPLLLAFWAFSKGVGWRAPIIWFWAAALGFFVIFSLGVNTPVFIFLREHIIGLELFRRPADAAYLINMLFALGLLIIGREASRFHAFESGPNMSLLAKRPGLVITVAVLILPIMLFNLGAAAGARGALAVLHYSYDGFLIRLFLGAVLLVGSLYLFDKSMRFLPIFFMAGALFFTLDLSFSGRYAGLFVPSYSNHEVAPAYSSYSDLATPSLESWLRFRTAPSDRVEIVGGPKAWGYSSTVRWHHTQGLNPIHLTNYSRVLGATDFIAPRLFPDGSEGPTDWRYDVLGMRYVAFYTPDLQESEQSQIGVQAKHYREALRMAGGAMAYTDGHYEVWTRPGKGLWLSLKQPLDPGDLTPAPCHLVKYNNVKLVVNCELEAPGTLVLGEVYAPGWMACVNSRPTDLSPYFGVFRSVRLPAGSSILQLRYRPIPFLRNQRC